MSWRIINITKRAKLSYQMNCMIIRKNNETIKIHLGEIGLILIESTAVSLTTSLLNELVKRKIKVIFCDEKRLPSSEIMPYYGSYDTSNKIRRQIKWRKEIKNLVWTEIVSEKIRQQMKVLEIHDKPEASLLKNYIEEIQYEDKTNREGHAAKVYFTALFGKGFTRTIENPINASLNYGYSILLSTFSREIVSNGYITQLGIFHDNMHNPYNLSSDLMEPFRPLIDKYVYLLNPIEFGKQDKIDILNILNSKVRIKNKKYFLNNAIEIYCKSIFDAIEYNDISHIRFYNYEL